MRPALTPRALNRRMVGAGLTRRQARGGGGVNRPIPQQIPGLFAWWDAGSGIAISTGVSAWTSRVNGRVLTQGTGAKQPAQATGSELNSKPVVRFDGVDDVLVTTDPAADWGFLHNGQGFTILAAGTPRLAGNYTWLATASTAGGSGLWFRIAGDVSQIYPWVYNGLSNVIGGTPTHAPTIANDLGLLFDFSYGTSATPDYDLRTANVSRYSGNELIAPDAGPPSANFAVGGFSNGGGFGKFDLADVLVYSRVLGAAEHLAAYSYLAGKYV